MDTKHVLGTMEEIQQKLRSTKVGSEGFRSKLVQEIGALKTEYSHLEIQDEKLGEALVKKGQKTLKQMKTNDKNALQEVQGYLRYLHAAVFDIRGNLQGLNYLIRTFLLTAMLFMALSPQFFGFLLPLVFLIPVFLGLRGLKQRNRTGLLLSLSVAPVAFLTGLLWSRYGLYALSHFNQVVGQTAADLNQSAGVAKMFVIIPSVLGLVLLVAAVFLSYFGYRYRKLFV